jgi:cobalt-zinc-cadmium efflux system outer membrane protein
MKRNCVLPLCLGALFVCFPAKPQEKAQTTLEDLVRTSLDRNREVLALRQRVAQARGLARQAGLHPAPSIEAEGLSGTPLGSPGDQEFSAAFVQPVEAIGKRKNRVRVADSAVALAEAELDGRRTQIAYEIEMGYLSVVYERERIAVLDRVSDSLRESLRLMEARVREGDAAPLEAQLLAVEQSRVEAQRADATGRLASASLELRRLVGLTGLYGYASVNVRYLRPQQVGIKIYRTSNRHVSRPRDSRVVIISGPVVHLHGCTLGEPDFVRP